MSGWVGWLLLALAVWAVVSPVFGVAVGLWLKRRGEQYPPAEPGPERDGE